MKKTISKRGFTLVELVVVITIIAILMALALITINTVRKQLRNSKLRHDAQTIKAAIEAYKTSTKDYPVSPDWLGPNGETDHRYGSHDRVAYDMLVSDPGIYNSGSLAQYISGEPPTNTSTNGAKVCYNRLSSTKYRLWVVTEDIVSTLTTCAYDNKCACGQTNIPSGDIYSQEQ